MGDHMATVNQNGKVERSNSTDDEESYNQKEFREPSQGNMSCYFASATN